MALMDNLRDKFKFATRTAVKASSDFIEVTKINMAIKSEEDKIKEILLGMGKTVLASYKDGKLVDSELSVKCDEIVDCEKNIEKLRLSVMEIKNMKKCTNCYTEIGNDDVFCPKCGTRSE